MAADVNMATPAPVSILPSSAPATAIITTGGVSLDIGKQDIDFEDKPALWGIIESTYWESLRLTRETEDRKLRAKYDTAPIKDDLIELLAERQELMARVSAVTDQIVAAQEAIRSREDGLVREREELAALRGKQDGKNAEWFRRYRMEAVEAPPTGDARRGKDGGGEDRPRRTELANESEHASRVGANDSDDQKTVVDEEEHHGSMGAGTHAQATNMPELNANDRNTSHQDAHLDKHLGRPVDQADSRSAEAAATTATDNTQSRIEVHDGDGTSLGFLEPLQVENQWIQRVRQLPVKRGVAIRTGRRFSLQSVYEPTDLKWSKWLSCYIQATGEIQEAPCQTCAKGAGVFSHCVVVGGDLFPRCGNCEWTRKACAASGSKSRQSLDDSSVDNADAGLANETSTQSPERKTPVGFTAVNQSGATVEGAAEQVNAGYEADADDEAGAKQVPKQRKSLPTSGPRESGSARGPSPHRRDATAPGGDDPAATDAQGTVGEQLPEITKSTLSLRHNGTVFTDPPLMRGVPVEKLQPGHPYWEPDWQPIEAIIQPALDKWKEKLDNHVRAGTSSSSKFLAGRQVNRGTNVMKYLHEGEIHPYQIVGKQWINKTFANYDTLFRMTQILSELVKFNLDVKPTEWLRERLSEIYLEEGEEFNLTKVVHNLYHDPKVLWLRQKNGFGNIGRPSGYKLGESTAKPKAIKPAPAGPGRKRKELHATPTKPDQSSYFSEDQTPSMQRQPRPSGGVEILPPQIPEYHQEQPLLSASPRHKKQRTDSGAGLGASFATVNAASSAEDLAYDGYTSHDTYSGDVVMKVDWRVYQVKTRRNTTSTEVTQYWHWVEQANGGEADGSDSNLIFEHQVLRDVLPNKVSWGVYKEPLDFHLRLRELTEITYSSESHKVIIGTKEVPGVEHRGDVMAHFKRERTKRRFLAFMRKKGVKLVKKDGTFVESAWQNLQSDVLPHYESD